MLAKLENLYLKIKISVNEQVLLRLLMIFFHSTLSTFTVILKINIFTIMVVAKKVSQKSQE